MLRHTAVTFQGNFSVPNDFRAVLGEPALMRWPWQPRETREATGGYTGIISALIGAQAAGTTQQASATAATEAVAGALSRAFADARVDGPADIATALTPRTLALIGRDLVRVGESLHVIRMSGGRLRLFPASTWYWEGGADPADWIVTATVYGPSGSSTWRLPQSSVVFVTWGSPTARPYHGLGPGTWAADTSRLTANAERALANEAGGPVAQLLPVPQDGGDGRRGRHGSAWRAQIRYQRREGLGAVGRNDKRRMGARALSTRRAPIGSNNASGRCRPRQWSGSRSPPSRGRSRRPVARLPCSTTRTERRSARRCGNGIWALSDRSQSCWPPS